MRAESPTTMLNETLGFLGAGQMATALAQGFVKAGLIAAERIAAVDPFAAARAAFSEKLPGVSVGPSEETAKLIGQRDIVVLAVKPQQIAAATSTLAPLVSQRQMVISIAAGVSLATLERHLPAGRLVRVMPNTPCLVGAGASAFALGRDATDADAKLVGELFGAVGKAFAVQEKLLDAVTGLSGSGPAFVYLVIEALSDGGVLAGLPRDIATALAAQTVRGAAEMVLATGEHPGVLKDRVASPAGTTIAGLAALEDAAIRAAFVRAVDAASRRATELGKQ